MFTQFRLPVEAGKSIKGIPHSISKEGSRRGFNFDFERGIQTGIQFRFRKRDPDGDSISISKEGSRRGFNFDFERGIPEENSIKYSLD
jgi:hypothetical protein